MCYGHYMNTLHLLDTQLPQAAYALSGAATFALLACVVGTFYWAIYYFRLENKTRRQTKSLLYRSQGPLALTLVVAFVVIAAVVINNLAMEREARLDNRSVNSAAITSWSAELYGVDLGTQDAAYLQHISPKTWSEVEAKQEIVSLRSVVVKDDKGELLKIQLIWDGERYILIKEGGGELPRR